MEILYGSFSIMVDGTKTAGSLRASTLRIVICGMVATRELRNLSGFLKKSDILREAEYST